MQTIPIRTASASYDVLLGTGLLARAGERLREVFGAGGRRFFVVTSAEIWRLWGEELLASFDEGAATVLTVAAGEEQKRFSTVERLAEELAGHGADRAAVVLAFGGGVIGDMAGFLAAIYMRGVEYVQIPTTLLAQVDSSVGGKTGVNLAAGKNLVGAFHHPRLVLADTGVLATLPDRELRAGLLECVKAGLIRDAGLFEFMRERGAAILGREGAALTRVIGDSVRMKAEVVGADERESGLRMILNFGHTLGHALEAATGYRALLHGEAVGWGMLAAVEMSRRRGLLRDGEAEAAAGLIRSFGLPGLPGLDAESLVRATGSDKKNRGGRRRFVLLRGLGEAVVVEDVSDAELLAGAEAMLEQGVGAA